MFVSPLLPAPAPFAARGFFLFFWSHAGARQEVHAKRSLHILDPTNKLFERRWISKEMDAADELKSLDQLLSDRSLMLVVDDSPDVWSASFENLLIAPAYWGDPATDEYLSHAAVWLRALHERFFADYDRMRSNAPVSPDSVSLVQHPDIRQVLQLLVKC